MLTTSVVSFRPTADRHTPSSHLAMTPADRRLQGWTRIRAIAVSNMPAGETASISLNRGDRMDDPVISADGADASDPVKRRMRVAALWPIPDMTDPDASPDPCERIFYADAIGSDPQCGIIRAAKPLPEGRPYVLSIFNSASKAWDDWTGTFKRIESGPETCNHHYAIVPSAPPTGRPAVPPPQATLRKTGPSRSD